MKPNSLKISVFFSLIALALSSCLKDDLQEPEIIIEPIEVPFRWKETEHRTGTKNWQTITDGDVLVLWFSDLSDSPSSKGKGEYFYRTGKSAFNIQPTGLFGQKDSLILFTNRPNGTMNQDTVAVPFKIYGDTSLVIRNTLAVPVIEMKYKKIK